MLTDQLLFTRCHAAAFTRRGATPIPVSEFPFGRAFEDSIDYGRKGPALRVWGYHFGHAFRRPLLARSRSSRHVIADGICFTRIVGCSPQGRPALFDAQHGRLSPGRKAGAFS